MVNVLTKCNLFILLLGEATLYAYFHIVHCLISSGHSLSCLFQCDTDTPMMPDIWALIFALLEMLSWVIRMRFE